MKRFLVDNQLPVALARWLTTKGCHAEHVLSLDLARAKDEEIWARAAIDCCIIVTKDEDFPNLTLVRPELVAVVWLRVGNCRTVDLLATMDRAWPDIVMQLDAGARVIEVR